MCLMHTLLITQKTRIRLWISLLLANTLRKNYAMRVVLGAP